MGKTYLIKLVEEDEFKQNTGKNEFSLLNVLEFEKTVMTTKEKLL